MKHAEDNTFDASRWPLVVVTLGASQTDEEQAAIFRGWEEALARREKFVGITDARRVNDIGTAKRRAQIAQWLRSIDAPMERYCLGHALVIEKALVRGAVTAIDRVYDSRAARRYVGTMAEAVDYCVESLRAAGLVVPPRVSAYRAALAGKVP